jgi:hypothetical protein
MKSGENVDQKWTFPMNFSRRGKGRAKVDCALEK